MLITKARKPAGYWADKDNVKLFLLQLGQNLKLHNLKDWNSITKKTIVKHGGSSILKTYSLFDLKCLAYPKGKKTFSKPKKIIGFWENKENVQNFLNKIQKKYNLNSFADWDSISAKKIQINGGSTLLGVYSLYEIKCMGFPEGKSNFVKRNRKISSEYWNDEENVKKFLENLQIKLQLTSFEDWNSLSKKRLINHGGGGLLNIYSMYDIKCIAFPEGKSYFSKPVKSALYWDNLENIENFIKELKEKYNLQSSDDWKRISKRQIIENGGWGFLKKYAKEKISKEDKNLDFPLLDNGSRGRTSQRWLFLQVQKLFPGEEIVEDYFHSEISRETGFPVQFDIFLLERQIAIEYHGKQHYEDIPTFFAPLELYVERDKEKEKLCSKYNINLIVIPYWWNNTDFSLKNAIQSKINSK